MGRDMHFDKIKRPAVPTPPVIGIMGAKYAGKDTVAGIIMNHRRYVRLVFGDVLKTIALRLDPIVEITKDDEWFGIIDYRTGAVRGVDYKKSTTFVRLSSLIFGERDMAKAWDEAKKIDDVRRLLQRMGTEAGRQGPLGDNVWVNVVADAYWDLDDDIGTVITDVRFNNEIEWVRFVGGVLIRVDRDEVEDGDPHPSEREWRAAEPDYRISNNGTIAELEASVLALLDDLTS